VSRSLVSFLFTSVDGVVEEPSDWVGDRVDDSLLAHIGDVISLQDAVLLGRRTYEYWAPHWPTAKDEPFASFINGTQKYVASTTMRPEDVTWAKAELIEGDLGTKVQELKDTEGGNIGVHASPTLVGSLVELGLLDELRIIQFPAVAGKGQRLLDGLAKPWPLELVDVSQSTVGALFLTYVPA
jgi:dihydrofolate reductase